MVKLFLIKSEREEGEGNKNVVMMKKMKKMKKKSIGKRSK
jgi:hypothetical protein